MLQSIFTTSSKGGWPTWSWRHRVGIRFLGHQLDIERAPLRAKVNGSLKSPPMRFAKLISSSSRKMERQSSVRSTMRCATNQTPGAR